MDFSHLHVVLVETSHPGNIGSAARAMKTMGVRHLSLVQPKQFPDPTAISLAAGADDILDQCEVSDSLETVLKDSQLVFGCSARKRHLNHILHTPESAGEHIAKEDWRNSKISIVFGNEQRGLTNEQLQQCHCQIYIPTHSDYRSINLAQSVQIVMYVITRILSETSDLTPKRSEPMASFDDMNLFFDHLDQTLHRIGFFQRPNPEATQTKLHHLFKRSQLKRTEVAMLRGLLSAVDKQTQIES